jgi:hypothetical protein
MNSNFIEIGLQKNYELLKVRNKVKIHVQSSAGVWIFASRTPMEAISI